MSPLLQSGCLLLLLYHTAACYTPPLFAGRGGRGAGGGDAQGGGGGAALACAALLGLALLAAACAVPTANLAQVVSEHRPLRETQFLNEDNSFFFAVFRQRSPSLRRVLPLLLP